MPRSYRHIKEYEKEILELKEKDIPKEKSAKNMVLHMNNYTISYHAITGINGNFLQE